MEEKKEIGMFFKGMPLTSGLLLGGVIGIVLILIFSLLYLIFSIRVEYAILIIITITAIIGVIGSGIKIVPPRHVFVVRNRITGELTPKAPGLTFVVPVIEEVFRDHDCHPVVETPTVVDTITKDAQTLKLVILRSYWIDALEREEDKFKKGEKGKERAKIAAIKISGETREEIKKEIGELVKNYSEAYLKKFVAQASLDDFEKDTIPEGFEVECPRCGSKLIAKGEEEAKEKKIKFPEYCPGEKCDADWSEREKKVSFPQTLLSLVSFATSIWTDKELAERFGIGCDIKLLSREMPGGLVRTKLEEQIFEAKERAKRAEKRAKMVEAETLRDFHQRTKISPSLVYMIDQIRGIVEGIISVVRKEEEEKERKEEK